MAAERLWRWLLVILMIFLVGALAVAGVVFGTKPTMRVTVRSSPPRATVFNETGRQIGVTPIRLRLQPEERVVLLLVRKGCRDKEVVIEWSKLFPQGVGNRICAAFREPVGEMMVGLDSRIGATLVVTTEPIGVEVFLDGVRLGIAPLTRKHLAAGTQTLRFACPNYFPKSKQITLEAGKETPVHVVLKSKIVVLYKDLIRKEPHVMTHYAELAHHHVQAGEFKAAAEVLRQGLAAVAKGNTVDPERYFSELNQIYIRYYHYPEETEENKIHPVVRALVQEALDKKLWIRKRLTQIMQGFNRYDKSHGR